MPEWIALAALSIITASTPLVFAAVGEIVVEKSGVLNLGVEGMMIMGAIDDLGSLSERFQSRAALTWRIKFGVLLLVSVVASLVLFFTLDISSVNIPWAGTHDLGPIYIVNANFTIFATTSSRAITDGLDGLLGGTTAVAFAAYAVIAFTQGQEFLSIFSFTVVGALLGFLWFNAHPAQVFMGDTGALPLGAALATVALMTGHWLLLPVIGFVFVAEAVSNIIQIGYFKISGGKRVFLRAPLHHHFEEMGWPETLVIIRFWIVSIAAAMLGVALALAVPA